MIVQKYKGFTLVEILLVITLLSILLGIVIFAINPSNIISEVNDNQREADAMTIYQALEQYSLKNNEYPEGIKNMPNNSSSYICKTSATSCNSWSQVNLSSILVPTYISKIPEYSTDANNSGFYVVKDSNGKIGIGGVKQVNNTTFVKGLESQSFATVPTRPWTPTQISTALWLDANDPSAITEVSGAASQINDKSGNNRHAAQSTAASRPAIATASGKQVLRFDGVNDFLNINSSFFPSGAQSGVSFIIAAVTDVAFENSSERYGSVITTHSDYSYSGCALVTGNARWRPFPPSDQSVQNVGLTGFQVVTMVATAGATGTMTLYKNGTQIATGPFSNTVTNSTKTQIGPLVVDDTNYSAKFDLHQLIVVTGTSIETVRQQLEGYLAWMNGLQNNLPINHPYKNGAPTI